MIKLLKVSSPGHGLKSKTKTLSPQKDTTFKQKEALLNSSSSYFRTKKHFSTIAKQIKNHSINLLSSRDYQQLTMDSSEATASRNNQKKQNINKEIELRAYQKNGAKQKNFINGGDFQKKVKTEEPQGHHYGIGKLYLEMKSKYRKKNNSIVSGQGTDEAISDGDIFAAKAQNPNRHKLKKLSMILTSGFHAEKSHSCSANHSISQERSQQNLSEYTKSKQLTQKVPEPKEKPEANYLTVDLKPPIKLAKPLKKLSQSYGSVSNTIDIGSTIDGCSLENDASNVRQRMPFSKSKNTYTKTYKERLNKLAYEFDSYAELQMKKVNNNHQNPNSKVHTKNSSLYHKHNQEYRSIFCPTTTSLEPLLKQSNDQKNCHLKSTKPKEYQNRQIESPNRVKRVIDKTEKQLLIRDGIRNGVDNPQENVVRFVKTVDIDKLCNQSEVETFPSVLKLNRKKFPSVIQTETQRKQQQDLWKYKRSQIILEEYTPWSVEDRIQKQEDVFKKYAHRQQDEDIAQDAFDSENDFSSKYH